MQALMLAAGMGKRLGKFTNNNTKCMVEVADEKPAIEDEKSSVSPFYAKYSELQ